MGPYYHDWVPPSRTDGYSPPIQSTPWYLWTPESVSIVPTVSGVVPDQTVPCNSTTLFWDFRTCRYIGVPTDCRTQDAEDLDLDVDANPAGWSTLRYQYIVKNGVHMTR